MHPQREFPQTFTEPDKFLFHHKNSCTDLVMFVHEELMLREFSRKKRGYGALELLDGCVIVVVVFTL